MRSMSTFSLPGAWGAIPQRVPAGSRRSCAPLQNGLDAEWARVRRELKREQVGRNKAKHLHAQLLPETYRPVTP